MTWWSKAEKLKVAASEAIRVAVAAAQAGFGEWVAWVRPSKGRLKKVEGTDTTVKLDLPTTTSDALIAAADREFEKIEKSIADANKK